jgi:hypothetical protein
MNIINVFFLLLLSKRNSQFLASFSAAFKDFGVSAPDFSGVSCVRLSEGTFGKA